MSTSSQSSKHVFNPSNASGNLDANIPVSSMPPSMHLYRILSFERAVQILKENKLYFAHPSTWEDPFEKAAQHNWSKDIFAQCWCRRSVSDAMWRIYSPNEIGVRIGTTRKRLEKALSAVKRERGIRYRINEVTYLPQKELRSKLPHLTKAFQDDETLATATEALFMKRDAFVHEDETRVVIYDRSPKHSSKRDGLSVTVDAQQLIKSILIDPRAPKAYVDAFTFYLKKELGFSGSVKKSVLYAAYEPPI